MNFYGFYSFTLGLVTLFLIAILVAAIVIASHKRRFYEVRLRTQNALYRSFVREAHTTKLC